MKDSGVMGDHVRICFISFMFSPSIGGAQARAEKQARKLQALGHDVIVITLRLDRRWERIEMLNDLLVVRVGGLYRRGGFLRIGRLGIWPITIVLFLTLWRLRHRYDVIHACQASPLAAVGTLMGKITGKPVIISIQNTGSNKTLYRQLEGGVTLMADTLAQTPFLKVDFKDWASGADDLSYLPRSILGGQLILNVLRKSQAIFQVLNTGGQFYLASHRIRSEQVVHISGSVDTEKFRPAPERQPDPMRPERDIICVARLDYSKGIDVLLHAWGRMMRASAEWRAQLKPRLHIVGDGALRSQMEYIAAELSIRDSVEFLGLRTDVIDLLQQSWGFVLPSRWEGMPNALLEAMACGLPCVATCVSGSEDVIDDGVNGLLVEPEQPAALAQALRRLVEDVALAQRLGQAGRATMLRDYQLKHVVEQCLELYRHLLGSSKNGNAEAEHPEKVPLSPSTKEGEGSE